MDPPSQRDAVKTILGMRWAATASWPRTMVTLVAVILAVSQQVPPLASLHMRVGSCMQRRATLNSGMQRLSLQQPLHMPVLILAEFEPAASLGARNPSTLFTKV